MNTIKLNDEFTFQVESFSKSTYFGEDSVTSTGNITMINIARDNLDALNGEVTSIVIYHDGEEIYNSTNLHGHINTINEYLSNNQIYIGMDMRFE